MVTTAKASKAVNFSPDQTSRIRTAFMVALTTAEQQKSLVESLAKEMGKGTRSIIAKASAEKVYKTFERTTKTGTAIATKADIVRDIAKKFNLDETAIGSLESASKGALQLIFGLPKAKEADAEFELDDDSSENVEA